MEDKIVNDEKYNRLYNKYKQLNVKIDNAHNPIVISTIGGTLIACTLTIGKIALNVNIPYWAIVGGFFVGESALSLPLFSNIYRISKLEDKMVKIADKYSHVINLPEGYYNLDTTNYFSSREEYLKFYYDQLEKDDKGPAKKLKKSK
jgi:hypothetical protein